MTRSECLRQLEIQLDMPGGSLVEGRALAEIETWDSMAQVVFIAFADVNLETTLSGQAIAECETVDDLLALVSGKLAD